MGAVQLLLDCEANRLQAFALPDSLGVIAVSDVPHVTERRRRLLPLAARLAQLGDDVLDCYTRPDCDYSVGWSRGQESMSPGQRDSLKGSFYANPLTDDCTDTDTFQENRSAQLTYDALKRWNNNVHQPASGTTVMYSCKRKLLSCVVRGALCNAVHCLLWRRFAFLGCLVASVLVVSGLWFF